MSTVQPRTSNAVAGGVQECGERHHPVEPVGPALMAGAAVVVAAADPDAVVDIVPEETEVACNRLN